MMEFLFSFKGRIGRQSYWLFLLGTIVVGSVVGMAEGALNGGEPGIAYVTMVLLMIWPSIAIQIKRWHDTDRSGWWVLINFIPIIGPLWSLVVNGFIRGTDGPNKYGDDPLVDSAEAASAEST